MEWKEVAPAAFVALIFAVVVARVISLVVPFKKRDHVLSERTPLSSYYSPVTAPNSSSEQKKTDTLAFSIAESSNTSDLGIFGGAPDPRQSLYVESHTAGGDEDSAYEDNNRVSPVIETLAATDAFSEDVRVADTTTSMDTERRDDQQHVAETAEPAATGNLTDVERRDSKEDTLVDVLGVADSEVLQQSVEDDLHDWEGVESTELEERFGAAANHVAKLAVEHRLKVSNDVQLQLYALYKLATEGACNTPQPSALKIASRAKWNAWQKLGVIEPEEAMLEYIKKVIDIDPTWNEKSQKSRELIGLADTSKGRGGVGPVLSTLATSNVHEGGESDLDAIHAYARDGDKLGLLKVMDSKTPIDLKDDEGRTALHWAADRGRLNIVKVLVSKGADVHAKDQEGQTPLHYATCCEQEAVAMYLMQHGADPFAHDNEGVTPSSCCPSSWAWMTSKT